MKNVCKLIVFSAFAISNLGRPVTAEAQVPEAFFVFGDSLSDTGNDFIATKFQLGLDPALPPSESPHRTYFQGRFSNGPVAFEYFWCALTQQVPCTGLTPSLIATPGVDRGISFAFGQSGSGDFTTFLGSIQVPGLRTQVAMFQQALQGTPPPAHALYAIFTGAIDYLAAQPADPDDVVRNIVGAIQTLYGLGARNVMVVDLPDLGLSPGSAGDRKTLSKLAAEHNRRLAHALKDLDKHDNLPGINLIAVTLKEFFKSLPRNTDFTTAAVDTLFPPPPPGQLPVSLCVFTNPANCPDVPTFTVDPRHFFWDAAHPTTTSHALLGQYFLPSLDPEPHHHGPHRP